MQKMPKFAHPNNSPPVIRGWKNGAVPVQEPTSSEYAKRQRQDANASEGFAVWWRGVREAEALLPPEAEENIDYIGKMPWPEFVAFETLYASYIAVVKSAYHILSRKQFRRGLTLFTEIRYHSVRRVAVKTHHSKRHMKRLETFFSTGKK